MSKAFSIKKGKYDIPGIGKVDATQEVSDEKAFEIYQKPRRVFPWITPGPEAESFLKKQKLNSKQVAALVQNAATVEEVELLASLNDAKAVKGVVDVKLKSLENDKK